MLRHMVLGAICVQPQYREQAEPGRDIENMATARKLLNIEKQQKSLCQHPVSGVVGL